MRYDFEDFVTLGRPATMERSISGDVDAPPSEGQLLRILECPVCLEFPTPPIFNCTNGHFVCNSCMAVQKSCTTCSSPFTRGRNYAVEAIIEGTKFRCKHRENGCMESVLGTGYLEHVKDCLYRPLTCREVYGKRCNNATIKPKMYLKHLMSEHGAVEYEGKAEMQEFDGESLDLPVIYVRHKEVIFLLRTAKHKSFICWWVTTVNPKDAERYRFATLTWSSSIIINDYWDQPLLSWKVPIHPEARSFEYIRDKGMCAVLPIQQVRYWWSENRCHDDEDLWWKIKVHIEEHDPDPDIPTENAKILKDSSLINALQHYFPLILLLFVGVGLCFFLDTEELRNAPTESSDEYFGYRGFYFRKPFQSTG